MSAPKDARGIPPERIAAMRVVRDAARRHVGDRPGFDCLLGFLTFEQAGRADPGLCWSLFLEPAELLRRFTGRYESAYARRPLALFLLRRGIQSPDRDTLVLSSRILQQIETIRADRSLRWPFIFLDANEDGVAAAIAVHNGFWTRD
ncbi:hypothetical protein [Actinoplanes aureus]|uniref:Uncharacterized protein n=1 Tax=Actinoplanes aureus TaxID=2792083 RepID=A0A931CDV0_9ACTN|nr:hypothetical protein [Actinoplanes aureus]MBG0565373.1 hypothetical protein [Actinoplanes aureus]